MREDALPIMGFLRIMCYAAAKPNERSTSTLPSHHHHHSPAYHSEEIFIFFSLDFKIKNNNHDNQSFFSLLRTVLPFIDFIWNILTAEIPNHNKTVYSRSQGNVKPFIYKYLNFSRRNTLFIWSCSISLANACGYFWYNLKITKKNIWKLFYKLTGCCKSAKMAKPPQN